MKPRRSDFALAEAIREPGFSPRRADLPELFELLSGDELSARHAERALAGFDRSIHEQVLEKFQASVPPLRGRLCRLIGRLARRAPEDLLAVLVACLSDPDDKTRRNAVIALGKLGAAGGALDALLLAWDREQRVEHKRSIAAAFGKLGDERALERLNRDQSSDPELLRIKAEAILKIERTRSRGKLEVESIAAQRAFPFPVTLRFYCRRGIEPILAEEIESRLAVPRASLRLEDEAVKVVSDGPLERMFEPRTALHFALELPADSPNPSGPGTGSELGDHVVRALTSETARLLLGALGKRPIRYRLEWASAGHRRALTWQVAREVSARFPDLINDPSRAPWQAVIHERPSAVRVELVPRGLPDPRFTYRKHKPAAASHPTFAAALARIAGVSADDVVWDPFVGSGSELIERALLGPYAAIYGTDTDARALKAARDNLRAAGIRAELMLGDARSVRPPARPSLIITNPPMGRRLLQRDALEQLFRPFIARVADALKDGGRFVWISPLPERTSRFARAEGLLPKLVRTVDMGGFDAQIQVFVRTKRR